MGYYGWNPHIKQPLFSSSPNVISNGRMAGISTFLWEITEPVTGSHVGVVCLETDHLERSISANKWLVRAWVRPFNAWHLRPDNIGYLLIISLHFLKKKDHKTRQYCSVLHTNRFIKYIDALGEKKDQQQASFQRAYNS